MAESGYTLVSHRPGSWYAKDTATGDEHGEFTTLDEAIRYIADHPLTEADTP